MQRIEQQPDMAGLAGLLGWRGFALLLAAFSWGFPPACGEEQEDPPPGRWGRVRVKMEARGELFAPTGEDGAEVRRPFTASARLDFLEVIFADGVTEPASTGGGVSTAPHDACGVRHFFSADSDLSIDGARTQRSLGQETSTLIVSTAPAMSHFAIDTLLTREETELLAIAFDPALLDRILPSGNAGSDESRPSPELTAALLAIDTIGRPADAPAEGSPNATEGPLLVRSVKAGEEGEAAKILVTGTVHGAVDGVPTTIRVDGTYELDADGQRVKSGVVRLREKRLAGHVSPGFECDATFQMARRPAEGSQAVPAADEAVLDGMRATWARVTTGNSAGTPRTLRLKDRDGRFTLAHDARWRAVADDARGLVLRMVDDGALLAECTVSPLPPGDGGVTLDDFRRDIERSLGDRLGRFTSSEEPATTGEKRVLRVASEGTAGGVPLEWRHYLVEDGRGGRMAVTFTVERRFADRFGRADADFVDGLAPGKGSAP